MFTSDECSSITQYIEEIQYLWELLHKNLLYEPLINILCPNFSDKYHKFIHKEWEKLLSNFLNTVYTFSIWMFNHDSHIGGELIALKL
jgi:hypothetical protein